MEQYIIKDTSGNSFQVFSLTNKNGFRVEVCEFGASLLKFIYPDGTDIIVGPKHSIHPQTWRHFGSVCGRVAGRIRNASISIQGKIYHLEKNQDNLHHRHGGKTGFSRRKWDGSIIEHTYGKSIQMKYTAHDGEGGYPATAHNTVTYTLNDANELLMHTSVEVDAPSVANITNHVYWNLHGVSYKEGESQEQILSHLPIIADHKLQLNAHYYYEAEPQTSLPTGVVLPVADTALDFNNIKTIGEGIDDALCMPYGGYDHIFQIANINEVAVSSQNIHFAGQVATDKRKIEVWTSCPSIVLYTGASLPNPPVSICLESQFPADCPNIAHFPSIAIDENTPWNHTTVWKFM